MILSSHENLLTTYHSVDIPRPDQREEVT